MEKLKNTLELTLYTKKNGSCWYCHYYFYNGRTYEEGTTRASGYGYDKHSTALSNAINHFNYLFTFKKGIKWESESTAHSTLKNKIFYGCYKDKSISYGIGEGSVLNCLGLFNNVKLIDRHYGMHEDFYKLEITTSKEQLEKELVRLFSNHIKDLKQATTPDYKKHINKTYNDKKNRLLKAIKINSMGENPLLESVREQKGAF